MFGPKDVPSSLGEKADEIIQNPVAMFSIIGALFAIAAGASLISHLGSNDRGRPR